MPRGVVCRSAHPSIGEEAEIHPLVAVAVVVASVNHCVDTHTHTHTQREKDVAPQPSDLQHHIVGLVLIYFFA